MRSAGTGGYGAVVLVLVAAVSVQLGAAVAVLSFPLVGATGTVLLRVAFAAVLLLAVCRPRLGDHDRGDWLAVLGFGLSLAVMNSLIYQAIDRIPLGVAVTVEMLGPLTLSVLTGHRLLSLLWAAMALAGVSVLSGGGFGTGLDPVGVLFALGAATAWACYILLNARTGARFPRTDGLALAMAAAAVVLVPVGVAGAGTALLAPRALGVGAVIALLSSVVPYSLELRALRVLPPSTFSVLMSLSPMMAALAGLVVLGQRLDLFDAVAIVLVVGASIGAVLSAARPPR